MLLALAACGGDAPVSPTESVTLEELPASEVAELVQQEQAELARIEARRTASGPRRDSLQADWTVRGKDWDTRGPIVLCGPRQYEGAARIIGPEGGTLQAGAHTLVIPPGALDRPTVITAEAPTSLEVMVEFRPHGLEFLKRATVTLDYAHCSRPVWLNERVAYLGSSADVDRAHQGDYPIYDHGSDDDDGDDDDDEVLEWPESHDRGSSSQVDALIDHFSRYAVAF
jgi:hypothetical protein